MQRLLDAMTGAAAYLRNGRLDILATNPLGHPLYSEVFTETVRPANTTRFAFLNPRVIDFYPDTVAILRATAGRNPYDRALTDLIGELSTRSEEFRTRWAAHNVHFHRTGIKRLHHPAVGNLELTFESLELPADTDLRITTYPAEPGTPSADALSLLASWSATIEHDDRADATNAPDAP